MHSFKKFDAFLFKFFVVIKGEINRKTNSKYNSSTSLYENAICFYLNKVLSYLLIIPAFSKFS
jgi:hypothetical protein